MGNGQAVVAVVRPGEGRRVGLGSIDVVFKLAGAQTGGRLSIVEHPFPVGAIVPPHTHTREDEYSIVLEGEIGFRSGDEEVVLGAGGYVVKPRGEVHTMWNAGDTPARMIEIIAPAGLEDYFSHLAALIDPGPPETSRIAQLSSDYGISYAQPGWLPELISRYRLNPPPGPPPD